MLDRGFWKIKKSHTWADSTCLYLLESRAGLYTVVVEYFDGQIVSLASSFDWTTALGQYRLHKSHLMKNRTEWYEEILH